MILADYNIVLYRQLDGSWVSEVPAIGGCYALMHTREAALTELHHVFRLIAEEHEERGAPRGHDPDPPLGRRGVHAKTLATAPRL